MFDLPVDTAQRRREYTNFRKALLRQGFMMLQFSVYARFCANDERGTALRARVKQSLPPHGQVRLLLVTDHQFGKMEVFEGKSRGQAEQPPEQLMLF